MKETINANIGSVAFTVDRDAYLLLEEYLDDVRSRLSANVAETMDDICEKHCGRFERTPLKHNYEVKIVGSKGSLMRMSKIPCYESPYILTGEIQSAGV